MRVDIKTNIAILGATGHVSKSLIFEMSQRGYKDLYLYTRSVERCEQFLRTNNLPAPKKIAVYDEFGTDEYDVIINCTGIGSPKRLAAEMDSIHRITEEFDDLAISYLDVDRDVLYINLSSGAVYGGSFDRPVDKNTHLNLDTNDHSLKSPYEIAKSKAEVRHRSLKHLNIVDLRLFAYFSKFIDLNDKYFMCDVVSSIIQHRNMVTSPENIFRDYITPTDLLSLVECCIKKGRINDVFDVYSREPVDKFSILENFSKRYGLKYRVCDDGSSPSVTGFKRNYYSLNKGAQEIGYIPKVTSLEGLFIETDFILNRSDL